MVIPRGLWSDEAISVDEAHMGFGAMIHYLRTEDIHPPLYFSVLWVDVRLFGYGELAVRVPSIAAGTLIVPIAYLAGRACVDRRAGYIAAVLAAVAPLMVWYSQEARMYAFFMLFSLVGLWAAVRCLQDGGWRYWAALVLSAVTLFYNEYFGLLQVGAEVSAIVAMLWWRRRSAPGPFLVKRALVAAAALAGLMAPLVPYAYQQLARSAGRPLNGVAVATGSGGGGGSLSIYNVLALSNWALWGYHSNGAMADLNALWPALMLIVLLLLGRGLGAPTFLLAWCVAAPIALLFAAGLYQPNLFDIRYAAGVVPLLIVLAAILVARTTRTWTATTVATGLLVVLSVVALVDQQYDWGNPRLFDFQHTVAWITRPVPARRRHPVRTEWDRQRHPILRRVGSGRAGRQRCRAGSQAGVPADCSAALRDRYHRRGRHHLRGGAGAQSHRPRPGSERRRMGVPMTTTALDPRLRACAWRPDDRLSEIRRKLFLLVPLNVILAAWYFGWLCRPGRVGNPILFGLLLLCELFNLIYGLGFWWTALRARPGAPARRGLRSLYPGADLGHPARIPPAVDVLIPVYDEPIAVVEPTVDRGPEDARR